MDRVYLHGTSSIKGTLASLNRPSKSCSLGIYSPHSIIEEAFEHIEVSEDYVARRQIEEDYRLYGSRPEPWDAEVPQLARSSKLLLKREAPSQAGGIERPSKVRRSEANAPSDYAIVTAMDWNSGTSPLDAWLNQSAVPSNTTIINEQETDELNENLVAQESEEIKVFRQVHIVTAPSGSSQDLIADEDYAALNIGAQIYYRNIMDKHPKIPPFLARRLAEANLHRVERLHGADDLRYEKLEMPAPTGFFPPTQTRDLRDIHNSHGRKRLAESKHKSRQRCEYCQEWKVLAIVFVFYILARLKYLDPLF